MDGPRNYHAKWSQPYNETPTSNAFTDMRNLKKGQTKLLCRIDADSQTLKNLWFRRRQFGGWGECIWVMGWKSCETGLLWSLHNYKCDKFIWVIKNKLKKKSIPISKKIFFFFFVFLLFLWAAPAAYGVSQASGLIGAVAASLRQSHSSTGSEPRLQPTPQLTATPDR